MPAHRAAGPTHQNVGSNRELLVADVSREASMQAVMFIKGHVEEYQSHLS